MVKISTSGSNLGFGNDLYYFWQKFHEFILSTLGFLGSSEIIGTKALAKAIRTIAIAIAIVAKKAIEYCNMQ